MKKYYVLFRASDNEVECGFLLEGGSPLDVLQSGMFADIVANFCREYISSVIIIDPVLWEFKIFTI